MLYQIAGTTSAPIGVRQQPGFGSPEVARVDSTVRVIVLGWHGGWALVRLLSGAQAGATGWAPAAAVVAAGVGTVLDQTEMGQLFTLMRDARFMFNGVAFPIPYRYPKDGCFARAEIMARQLKGLGYQVDKVFAVCVGGLHVDTPYGSDEAAYGEHLQVDWWYHVAPLLYLRTGGSKPDPVVIDPSVATGPVSPVDWAKTFSVKPVENEISYEAMRQRLESTGAYPTDRTWLVRSGGVVYSLPIATSPRDTVEALAGQPEAVLAEKAAYVPAHEVIAAFDALFRACFNAYHQANRRDAALPIPNYAARRDLLFAVVDLLPRDYRQYIVTSFPKFLQDWRNTFVGSGIAGDVAMLDGKLNA